MNLLNTAVRSTIVGAVAAGTLVAAAPALAADIDLRDARGDISRGADIHGVRVAHDKLVAVRISHRDLRPRASAGAAIYLDTDRGRAGPEFAFVGGISDGTDYALVRTRGWSTAGARVNCFYSLRLDYANDLSHFKMRRACFGGPDAVRVAVRVGAARGDGTEETDWLHGRRHFTRWVARG